MSRILPILFNTEMVRAILDGRKTVTRRICKDGNDYTLPDMDFYDADKRTYAVHNYADKEKMNKLSTAERICPICPEDILYVRETWAFATCITCNGEYRRKGSPAPCYDFQAVEYDDGDSISDGCFIYRADHPHPERITWRPSIHMPKAAARTWLRVTDIKIQRLQEMTLDDFIKEGVLPEGPEECNCAWKHRGCPESSCTNRAAYLQERYFPQFSYLWDSTIPKGQQALYGWAANPWIWVIEFERCEKPAPCILEGIAPAEDKRPCIGYQKSKENDEPCEMCKGCGAYNGEKPEVQDV